jgi:hypothetical protein
MLVRLLTLAAIGGSLALPAHGAATSASATCRGAVTWTAARTVVGRVATVKGPVVGSVFARSSNGSPTFLNLGRDYPSPARFTVVIWIENRAAFGTPERRYRGRTICVRGLVKLYRGSPEVVARSPSQIAIAG